MVKLKPCPFCGGEAYFSTPKHHSGAFDSIFVECRHCGAHPYVVLTYSGNTLEEKQEEVARSWNRRREP